MSFVLRTVRSAAEGWRDLIEIVKSDFLTYFLLLLYSREKAAVCFIFLLVSSIFIGVFCIGPTLLCTSKTDSYDIENVAELGKDKLISVFGTVYDISKYIDRHPGGSNIMSYLGKDVSRIFPRLPASELPEYCIDRSKNMSLFEDVRCSQMSAEDYIRGVPCHNSSDAVGVQRFKKKFEKYEEGKLVIPQWKLMKKGMPDGTMFIVLGDSVYNVTQYVDLMRDPETLLFDSNEISDHENAFLNKVLHDLIFHKLNEDASVIFREMLFADELKE